LGIFEFLISILVFHIRIFGKAITSALFPNGILIFLLGIFEFLIRILVFLYRNCHRNVTFLKKCKEILP
jgi:hypothetical protein